jgi:hypothetical protein
MYEAITTIGAINAQADGRDDDHAIPRIACLCRHGVRRDARLRGEDHQQPVWTDRRKSMFQLASRRNERLSLAHLMPMERGS